MCVFKLFITFLCSRQTLASADRFRHLQIVSIKPENATEFIFSKFQKCKGAAMALNNLFSQPTTHSSSRILNATRSTQIQKNSNANAQVVRQAKIFNFASFLINIFGWNLLSLQSEFWLATGEGEKLQPQVNYMCCAHVGVKKMSAGRLINCTN